MNVAVELDHVDRPGALVKAVDVLADERQLGHEH
jgi:hypothetical protein